MVARSRSFDERSNFSGTYQNFAIGSTLTQSLATGANGTCDDTIGNFPNPNGLSITRLNRQYPGLVGDRVNPSTGVVERRMTNFPVNYHPGPTDPRTVFPALTTLQKSNYAWNILSKANPSAPDVSLPTFIAELKDMPSLVKNWYSMFFKPRKPNSAWLWERRLFNLRHWRDLFKRTPEMIANGHLSWRWAIKPFIRDVNTMIDFSYLVKKRYHELNKLVHGHGLRRRVQLGYNYSVEKLTNRILHSNGILIRGTRTTAFRERVWGTVRYALPDSSWIRDETNTQLLNRARNLVFGLTTQEALATAWELTPWSWFADWFLGVGEVIKATNNALGLLHSDCCLMRHSQSESTFDIDPATSETWAAPNKEWSESFDRKERFVVAPVIAFAPTYLPLFQWKTVSILASLAVTNTRPGRNLPVLSKRLIREFKSITDGKYTE